MDFLRLRNFSQEEQLELLRKLRMLLRNLEKGTSDTRLSKTQIQFLHGFTGDVRNYICYGGNLGSFAFISFNRLNSKGLYTDPDGNTKMEEQTAAEIVPEIYEIGILLGLYETVSEG